VGEAKEQPIFWTKLEKMFDFEKERTLLAKDTARILHSARQYGMAQLIFVARPSSRKPVSYSPDYPSITYFNELIF